VFKKYTYKKGKRYGPYYYENKRVGDKVITKYLGTSPPKGAKIHNKSSKKIILPIVVIAFLVLASLVIFIPEESLNSSSVGTGSIEEVSSFSMFSETKDKLVTFPLIIYDSAKSSFLKIAGFAVEEGDGGGDSGGDSEDSNEESSDSDDSESKGDSDAEDEDETEEDKIEDESEEEEDEDEQEEIKEDEDETEGDEIEDEDETEPLEKVSEVNETEIEDVETNITEDETNTTEIDANTTTIPENNTIEQNITVNETIVEDDQTKISNETVSNETIELNTTEFNQTILNVSDLILIQDIPLIRISKGGDYALNLSEYFGGAESYTITLSNISVLFEENIMTLTPDVDFSGSRRGKITASLENESLESNEFNILVSSGTINIETTTTAQIKVGEKVKWIKNVSLEIIENVTIELPKEAENITVKKVEEEIEEEIEAKVSLITGNVVSNSNSESKIFNWIKGIFNFVLTGSVVDENGGVVDESVSIEVVLDENATEYIIEYETEAPQAVEEETDSGKKVVVSGPDDLNYTNVLSFTNIPEVLEVGQEATIKIYWEENDSYVPFNAYDLDGNGKLDYVEWITPHLSNQTFNIILITDAQHLDENRTFISNIFEEVKEQDGIWSETINENEWVRVTFERNLTSGNDITIYPRTVSGSLSVEIYEKNGSELIAEFSSINDNAYNKVYLDNLIGEQDTFDLKILGGSVEFDHIIDPSGPQIDNVTTNSGNTGTFTHSHTSSGSNRLLVVEVALDEGADSKNVSSVLYGGTALTKLSREVYSGGNPAVEVWYLINPSTGENTVEVNISGGNTNKISLGAISLTNVSQLTPIDGTTTANGLSTVPSVTVTSEAGDLVMDVMASAASTSPTGIGAGQTERFNIEMGGSGASSHNGTGSTEDGASSVVMNWTLGSSVGWAMIGFNINPPNAAPTIDSIVLNSTLGTNLTTENLTVYTTTSDPENDAVKVIYNWLLNDTSVAVLNMPFEGESNASDTKDYSGFGNNGTVNGATWNSTGGYDGKGAYNFDRVDDFINITFPQIDNTLENNQSFSVSTWFKPNGAINSDVLLSKRLGVRLAFVGGTNQLYFELRDDASNEVIATTSGFNFSDGNFHHAAGVWDSSTKNISLYVDGIIQDSNINMSMTTLNSNGQIFIGQLSDSSDPFGGLIDEFVIWNRSLSRQQIEAIYDNRTDLIVSQETVLGEVWSVEATPNDGAQDGSKSTSNNVTIIVLNTNPDIDFVSPTPSNGSLLSQDYMEGNVTATDGDGLDTITLRLYNSTRDLVQSNTSATSPLYINFSGLSDGVYYMNATANDTSNNLNNTLTRKITLDNVNPSLTLVEPQNTTYSTTALEINFSASDTNLETCWYTNNTGVNNHTLASCANATYTAVAGSTTLVVYVNDSVNNVNSQQYH